MIRHLVHDVDRDGWGAAALLLARFGPNGCVLHPSRSKSVAAQVVELTGNGSDVWVLDIPAPPTWPAVDLASGTVTWVDHHLAAWGSAPPSWVRAILPETTKPTTTMSLLLRQGLALAGGAHAREFVRDLCRDGTDWGLALDGLADFPDHVHLSEEELRPLLARGPDGDPLPEALLFARDRALAIENTVADVLALARIEEEVELVVVHLDDARRIPLARYSLAVKRRHPEKVCVLVHRRRRLYCGRDSGRRGLDFVGHFRSRGLDPRGHAYVAFVELKPEAIDAELAALRTAIIGACP